MYDGIVIIWHIFTNAICLGATNQLATNIPFAFVGYQALGQLLICPVVSPALLKGDSYLPIFDTLSLEFVKVIVGNVITNPTR